MHVASEDKFQHNKILKRQKRVIVFRPLHVYRQQQKEKQKYKEKWKAQQQLNQQQYQSIYEQQYYQQYLQNYYNQFASSAGYYQNNQPNYAYTEQVDPYSIIGDEQSNYYNTGNDQYYNYYTPHQHTSSGYYPTTSVSAHNPSHYHNSLSSDYFYD